MDPASGEAVRVAVRFRPLTDTETERDDVEVWGRVDSKRVGIFNQHSIDVKYEYDEVLGSEATNETVYGVVAKGVVDNIPLGINGTVFAYGVTSSGKTHTMHGSPHDPGIVARALSQLFRIIHADGSRDYLVRLSYVEIYNEVVHDLLDPSRQHLRVVEDRARGHVVDGAHEEVLLDSEHALLLVAKGEAHRKVSATAYNQRSSRSHTLVRVTLESNMSLSEAPSAGEPGDDYCAPAGAGFSTRRSTLNLIDLAGSETAKMQQTKMQAREGGYINRSLLTLSTVIARLSDGSALPIPYRDSKLTRLLQSSLSGAGASTCIVCTVTPAGLQAEETHNTLKFASRAKLVKIEVHRQERFEAHELVRRYQQEVHDLRQQLGHQQRGSPHGAGRGDDAASRREIRSLREQLEQERAARLEHEACERGLRQRLDRLTALLLRRAPAEQREGAAAGGAAALDGTCQSNGDKQLAPGAAEGDGAPRTSGAPDLGAGRSLRDPPGAEALSGDAGAAAAIGGAAGSGRDAIRQMREHALVLEGAVGDTAAQLGALRQLGGVMQRAVAEVRRKMERSQEGTAPQAAGDAAEEQLPEVAGSGEGDSAVPGARYGGVSAEAVGHGQRLADVEAQLLEVLRALERSERCVRPDGGIVSFLQLEQQVESEMQRRLGENAGLLAEVASLEEQNNQLQGFNLDGMTASDLSRLIRTLTQAVERVRITVQLRRLSSPASSHSPAAPTRQPPGSVLVSGEGTVAGGVPPHPGQCHGVDQQA
eukprot:jgi/Tetstr1/433560/TSEL_022827.t1